MTAAYSEQQQQLQLELFQPTLRAPQPHDSHPGQRREQQLLLLQHQNQLPQSASTGFPSSHSDEHQEENSYTNINGNTNETNNTLPPNSMIWKNNLPKSLTPRQDGVATLLKCNTGGRGGSSQFVGVVLVGGRAMGQNSLDTVELYECRLRRWWSVPPLRTPRCGCMAMTLNNALIVAGGVHQDQQLDSAEKYTFGAKKQEWEPIARMPTPRWYGAAVGLSRHNLILLVGGRDDSWNELATVDAYNVEKNVWMPLESMGTPRFGCAAVSLSHSKVLVLGGFDGKDWITTCELYDYDSDTWSSSKIARMPIPVRFCVAATIVDEGKFVFVSGQVDDETYTNGGLMQCYNVKENKWAVLQCPKGLTACSLASFGQHLFALGGSTFSSQPAVGDFGDDQDTTISQETRSWKISDMDFAQLWNDEDHPTQIHQQPRAQPTSSTRQTTQLLQLSNQSGGSSEYMETSIVAVAVNNHAPTAPVMSDPVVQHHQSMAYPSLMTRSSSAMSTTESSVAGSSHPMYASQPESSISNQSMFGAIGGGAGMFPTPTLLSMNHVATTAMTIYQSNMSVVSGLSEGPRRLVEVESILDNYSVPVVYTGQVSERSGRPDGRGRMTWTTTGDIYEGSFRNGSRDGNGRMTYKNGDTFQGIYKDDQREGHGVYHYLKEHRTYDGLYADDEQEDINGTMTWKNGTIYIGQFKQSRRSGKGMVRFPNQVKYTGDFVNGKYHGFGVCKFGDGSVYEGQWRKGKAHGQGKLVNAQGQVVHDGLWVNDGPVFG
jgi:hypothetical protein